jgi:hypothetical protein
MFVSESNFKEPRIYQEYLAAPEVLKWIIDDFIIHSTIFGVKAICTRILGKIDGDSGVHDDYRAADFRQNHGGKILYSVDQELAIVKFINERYPRTDGKLACLCHSFNGGPKHFHLQLPDLLKELWQK